ncbi:polysaccharide transporter, PST family [Alkalibacterium putridalgicola]|uniref:Lipopolysaccharide biosynthesis protein n=1 Tax=Alkalibacterium putridalgicola TaxID=426703 RepID=A0A1H7QL15_9LACT|nr:lipopolysaccharide biosynthesis protein [Alkalibacterium putridalgicola]GEK88422.1 lipopolysaccharide biosynthesis protein [Alkalibacterium putridalgicola]SEL48652.1 polysaccharide transporter, PST family [Alkalibacterium putridalgicola]
MMEQFKHALFYTAIGKYSIVVVQLLVQAVLSRILTPAEYGIVAAVNIFLVFFQLLADFGIGPAVIQNKSLNKRELNDIFSFSLYVAVGLAVVFFFLGYPMSDFYGNPVYIAISRILAIAVFFYGVLVVPQSILLREKNFRLVNITTVTGALVSGVISIGLALLGFSYYAIIIGNTARAFIMFVIFYIKTETKISLKFNWGPLKKIFAFSRNQFLFNFINYFSRNLDNLLIGRYFSASALAYYDKAYQVSLYPNQVLTSLVTSVIHPILSDYEDEKERIKRVYLRISNLLATLGMPLSIFLFFAAEEVILFLFGGQWDGSVAAFQILALSIWIQMILSSTGGIFQSGNRTDLLLLSGILSTAFNITGIVIGILMGQIEYVAGFLVLAFSLNFIQANYLLMIKMFKSSLLEFFKVLTKPVILAVMQAGAFWLLPELPLNNFFSLVVKGLVFVVVWIIGLFITGEFKRLKLELQRARGIKE